MNSDRPTDRRTDRPTDRVAYRVACTRLKRTWYGWGPINGMSKEKWIGIWSIATGFVSQCPSISLCHNHWWWFMQCESKILEINFVLLGTVTSISEIQTIFQSINLYLRCLSKIVYLCFWKCRRNVTYCYNTIAEIRRIVYAIEKVDENLKHDDDCKNLKC